MGVLEKVRHYAGHKSYLARDERKGQRWLDETGLRPDLERNADRIRALLKAAEWWHGTGTHKYAPVGSSKYDSTSSVVTPILPAVCAEGLVPKQDVYAAMLTPGRETHTVSLSRNRMYAKVYALMHASRETDNPYMYGNDAFWYDCMLVKTAVEAFSRRITWALLAKTIGRHIAQKISGAPTFHSSQHEQMIPQWTADISQDKTLCRGTKTMLLGNMGRIRSDILQNCPILIGVARDAVRPLSLNSPPFALFEGRTNQQIPSDRFTHIETPLRYLSDVRRTAEEAGISAPVIPMEYAELLQSGQSMHDLLQPDTEAAEIALKNF